MQTNMQNAPTVFYKIYDSIINIYYKIIIDKLTNKYEFSILGQMIRFQLRELNQQNQAFGKFIFKINSST